MRLPLARISRVLAGGKHQPAVAALVKKSCEMARLHDSSGLNVMQTE